MRALGIIKNLNWVICERGEIQVFQKGESWETEP